MARFSYAAMLALVAGAALGLRASAASADDQSSIRVLDSKPKPPPPDAGAPPPPIVDDNDDPKHRPGQPGLITTTSTPPAAPPPATPPGTNMKVIPVPAGKTVDDVKPPPGAITSNVVGIGEPIAELKIVDNTRTQSNTIEYVSGLKIGQIVSDAMIDEARTRLYSTGLFKDISITWEAPSERHAGKGVRVVVRAKDKFPWVIAPIFSYQARNYGGGAAFAHNNVLGRGIKLLLYGDYTTAEKMLLAVWLDPSIRNSPFYYRIDALLRRDTIVEYARGNLGSPRVERSTDVDTVGFGVQLGVNIKRRFHIDIRLKIYYDWTRNPDCFDTTNPDFSGTPDVVAEQGGYCRAPSSSGWDNTITTSVGWDGRAKVNGVQKGLQATLSWQTGGTWLGDNWNYHLLNASVVYAFKFFKEHNLILRFGGDLQFNPPFKLEVEAGSIDYTLRGSVYRQFRGDTSAHATLEYIAPLFTVLGLSVRAIGFYDTNLTWFRGLPEQSRPDSRLIRYENGFRNYLPDTPSGVVRESWNNGIGAGIRMYLRGVVLPLIGFDVAYGIEANTVRYYLAIGSVLD